MAGVRSRSRRGRPDVPWTSFRADGRTVTLRCTRCDGLAVVKLPMEVKRLVRMIDGFNLMHADCEEGESTEARET